MFRLPPDVIGVNVLAMVNLIDVVNLDSATCSKKYRTDLHAMFEMAQPFDLRDPVDPSRYNGSPVVWRWYWKRKMTIKGLEVRGIGLEDISQHIAFVTSPLSCLYGYDRYIPGRGCTGSLSTFPAILNKIDCLALVDEVRAGDLAVLIPRMTRLTSIVPVDESMHPTLEEDDILQLLNASSSKLVEIKVMANASEKLLRVILPMGPTLRSLSISTSILQEEHYQLIAQHCPHLTSFHLEFFYGYNPAQKTLPLAGVLAIAQGCRHLQDVSIADDGETDHFLLLFATHCPDLRKIDCSRITDSLLQTLARCCPCVVEISAAWEVEWLDSVHIAASWLAQLRKVNWPEADPGSTSLTFRAALMYLRDVESLELQYMLVGEAELAVMATRCTRLRELIAHVDDSPAMGACVASLVRNNSRLETIKLAGYTWATNAVVEAIAESCPRLRVLECTVLSRPNPSALTDHAMVKLARGCPRLRCFYGFSGPGLTDISVLALAQHCCYLKRVEMVFATQVTLEVSMQLVEHTAANLKDKVV